MPKGRPKGSKNKPKTISTAKNSVKNMGNITIKIDNSSPKHSPKRRRRTKIIKELVPVEVQPKPNYASSQLTGHKLNGISNAMPEAAPRASYSGGRFDVPTIINNIEGSTSNSISNTGQMRDVTTNEAKQEQTQTQLQPAQPVAEAEGSGYNLRDFTEDVAYGTGAVGGVMFMADSMNPGVTSRTAGKIGGGIKSAGKGVFSKGKSGAAGVANLLGKGVQAVGNKLGGRRATSAPNTASGNAAVNRQTSHLNRISQAIEEGTHVTAPIYDHNVVNPLNAAGQAAMNRQIINDTQNNAASRIQGAIRRKNLQNEILHEERVIEVENIAANTLNRTIIPKLRLNAQKKKLIQAENTPVMDRTAEQWDLVRKTSESRKKIEGSLKRNSTNPIVNDGFSTPPRGFSRAQASDFTTPRPNPTQRMSMGGNPQGTFSPLSQRDLNNFTTPYASPTNKAREKVLSRNTPQSVQRNLRAQAAENRVLQNPKQLLRDVINAQPSPLPAKPVTPHVSSVQKRINNNNKREQAASKIQKAVRGHKGRQLATIQRELASPVARNTPSLTLAQMTPNTEALLNVRPLTQTPMSRAKKLLQSIMQSSPARNYQSLPEPEIQGIPTRISQNADYRRGRVQRALDDKKGTTRPNVEMLVPDNPYNLGYFGDNVGDGQTPRVINNKGGRGNKSDKTFEKKK